MASVAVETLDKNDEIKNSLTHGLLQHQNVCGDFSHFMFMVETQVSNVWWCMKKISRQLFSVTRGHKKHWRKTRGTFTKVS